MEFLICATRLLTLHFVLKEEKPKRVCSRGLTETVFHMEIFCNDIHTYICTYFHMISSLFLTNTLEKKGEFKLVGNFKVKQVEYFQNFYFIFQGHLERESFCHNKNTYRSTYNKNFIYKLKWHSKKPHGNANF